MKIVVLIFSYKVALAHILLVADTLSTSIKLIFQSYFVLLLQATHQKIFFSNGRNLSFPNQIFFYSNVFRVTCSFRENLDFLMTYILQTKGS